MINMFDPVYRVVLSVIIDRDPESSNRWLDDAGYTGERSDPNTKEGQFYALTNDNMKDGGASQFIWLRKKDLNTLSHELLHFVMYVFNDKNVPIRYENDETFAYYFEYWFNRVRKEWNL